jgi:actin-like ATPase involved in cell morphogenesis
MIRLKELRQILKNKYGLVVGEQTLRELKRKIAKTPTAKIKVSGRSYKTGKRKTVMVAIK